jgi:outer membrane protein assembly factor BamE (lipoprotein component of BamABCDE complex)
MKKAVFVSLVVSIALIGFSGCATDQGQASQPPAPAKVEQPAKAQGPWAGKLKVGMTKEEVTQAIGNPKNKGMNSDGSETWMYDDREKAFIPHFGMVHAFGGDKFNQLTINFDTNGKVKDWSTRTF